MAADTPAQPSADSTAPMTDEEAGGRLDAIATDVARYHSDGWRSLLQGFGVAGRDASHTMTPQGVELDDHTIDQLYRHNPIAFRIVELPAEGMTRRGWQVIVQSEAVEEDGESDLEATQQIERELGQYLKRLRLQPAIRKGLAAGRAWGGAIGVIGFDEGQGEGEQTTDLDRMSEELDETKIKSVLWIRVIDRRVLEAGALERDPGKAWFGTPVDYKIKGAMGSEDVVVHASRVLLFPGAPGSEGARESSTTTSGSPGARGTGTGDGSMFRWWDSVLQRTHEAVRDFDQAYAAAHRALNDFSVAKFGIKNLIALIKAGKEKEVRTRLETAAAAKSVLNAVLHDADHESFSYEGRTLAGVADLLEQSGIKLGGSTGVPLTKLLAISPGGFGTGQGETDDYDDDIRSGQTETVEPLIERVVELVLAADDGPTSGEDQAFSIKFNPLRQPTALELAQERETGARMAATLVDSGIITEDEAANSMFGGDEYTVEITLDLEARSEEAVAAEERASAENRRLTEELLEARRLAATGGPPGPAPPPGPGSVPPGPPAPPVSAGGL